MLPFISGMRLAHRLGKGLHVLQAFIDESVSTGANDGSGRLFVMAGFVAPVEKWVAFSDEWSSLLELGPPHWRRIEEFHMVEMAQSQLGLEQSELFYRVIEKHLDVAVACAVRLDDLKREHERIHWPEWIDNVEILKNEYYAGFQSIVRTLALHGQEIGIREPVDVVFDESMSAEKCLRGWQLMKSHFGHPRVRAMLGETPVFRSSKTSMPLQAADLIAYWLRKSMLAVPITDPKFKLNVPWKMNMRGRKSLCVYKTPEMIRADFRGVLLGLSLLRVGVRPDHVAAILEYGR